MTRSVSTTDRRAGLADCDAVLTSFRPGDRLPSVRETSESRGVSPSTVFQAYYLLEARGLVEARARSGYYVSHASAAQAEPAASEPSRASNRRPPGGA